jgi:long-chain acyl-CoA synthetase
MTSQDNAAAAKAREKLVRQSARSYAHMLRERVATSPDKEAFAYPSYVEPEVWNHITWAEVRVVADELAAGFLALGMQPEERAAIACSTRMEWILIDMGIACAAGVTTTIYPSTHVHDVQFILTDCDAAFAVVENAEQLAKVRHHEELDRQIRHIVIIDDDRTLEDIDPRVVTYEELRQLGREHLAKEPDAVDAAIDTLDRDSLSTLIYTSGTTGRPKGVELLHGAWTFEGIAVQAYGIVWPEDSVFIWLPLAHVFGRDLVSAGLHVGFHMVVDGRVPRIVQTVGETAPTILVGVPRIFEKVRAAVITMYPRTGLKGRISRWAFAVGRRSRDYRVAGKRMPLRLRMSYKLADKLVYSKLKDKLGGRMRLLISGSAKLSPQVQEWFYSAGLNLVEGYGLTETAAICTINLPEEIKFGTVGRALPGIEAEIADDGELLLRGPNVMRGYHKLPEIDAEALTDGWFHTGDIGEIDDAGFIKITDRKKDLLKTSNGKYVAPQKVENAIMANVHYAGQAVVVGEGRKYCGALVVLDPEALAAWAKRHGHSGMSYAKLSQLPDLRESIDRGIRRANRRLEKWETIKKYAVLDRELSMDNEELTPSLKVRRADVLRHFDGLVEQMYADDSPIPFVPPSQSKRFRDEDAAREAGDEVVDGSPASSGEEPRPASSAGTPEGEAAGTPGEAATPAGEYIDEDDVDTAVGAIPVYVDPEDAAAGPQTDVVIAETPPPADTQAETPDAPTGEPEETLV